MKIWHLISLCYLYFLSINCDYLIYNKQNQTPNIKLEKKFIEDFSQVETYVDKYLSVKYKFWKENIYGDYIKVGIVDSGVKGNFCNFTKIYNYSEGLQEDENGHGTYIASVICDSNLGQAPHSSIFIYKIFDKNRRTRSEWLISALEQAYLDRIDILNLSFGGINFDDEIVILKLQKLVSIGTIIVTSSGNDGPSYGTINFPGSLPFVVTVGATSKDIFTCLKQSSRGPAIYSKNLLINKPNTWAPGENIPGLDLNGNYTYKDGSSVSAAIVTGYLSLLLSHFKEKRIFFNIGSIMILIKESNLNFPDLSRDEFFSGIFSLDSIFKITNYYLKNPIQMKPQIFNNLIDFSLQSYSNFSINADIKLFQIQPFYSTIQPIFFPLIFVDPISKDLNRINLNYTIENSGQIADECLLLKITKNSKDYESFFHFSTHVGVLQMSLTLDEDIKCRLLKEKVVYKIQFQDSDHHLYTFKLIFDIIPTPSRFSRVLISRYHNLFYPFDGSVPKDNLFDNWYNFDWTYESLNTNYFSLNLSLKKSGLFVEESNESLDCVNLSLYSVLAFIDTESHLSLSEIYSWLRLEYENNHLSLLFITDWYHPQLNEEFKLINIDGLSSYESSSLKINSRHMESFNVFLNNYGVSIKEDSISKTLYYDEYLIKIKSASSISKFPSDSYLFGGAVNSDIKELKFDKAILGLMNKLNGKINSGRLAIFTDTYCLDDYQMRGENENCLWLINSIIK